MLNCCCWGQNEGILFHHEDDVTSQGHFFEIVYFILWELPDHVINFSLEVMAFFSFQILHILRISTVYNKYGNYCSQLLLFNLVSSAFFAFFFCNQSIILCDIFFFHHVCIMMYLNLQHILNICHQKDQLWKRPTTRKSDSQNRKRIIVFFKVQKY